MLTTCLSRTRHALVLGQKTFVTTVQLHAKDNLSKTDAPCKWIRHKEPAQVYSVEDMFPAAQSSCLDCPVTPGDREWFQQQLTAINTTSSSSQTSSFIGFSWLLPPEPSKLTAPVPVVRDVMLEEGYSSAANKVEFIMDRLKLTHEQVRETEIARETTTFGAMLDKGA